MTSAEWRACTADSCGWNVDSSGKWPAAYVTWEAVQDYIGWLNGRLGLSGSGTYRLLSESEWEYAARAGTPTAHFWGANESDQCRHANGADLQRKIYDGGWTIANCDDGYFYEAPVGSFSANRFGLHDMFGNVWEWTQDCWNESYAGAPSDGGAWESGDCSRRVIRGGSYFDPPSQLRAAYRTAITRRGVQLGFRVARTLTPEGYVVAD